MVGMFDVGDKADTLRYATAQAIVKVSPATVKLVNEGKSPKGNIVDAARISATMAAKRTWDLLPFCHPIPIDHIKIDIVIKENTIEVSADVKTTWKTGVEMEALTAASVGALTIYDMLKPVDEGLWIDSIRLVKKTGGSKTFYEDYEKPLKAAILVISDSASKGSRADKSGKLAEERLNSTGFEVVDYKIVPDNEEQIKSSLVAASDELMVDLVLTCGGTGLGPRDVTPEATKKVILKEVAGISEALRNYGQRRTPLSMLSRGIAGVRGKTIIVNLPGSVRAVSESLDTLIPGITHASKMIGGHGH